MTVLVVGASGATGRLLTRELLQRGQEVRVIVRSPDRLPEDLRNHGRITVVQADVLAMGGAELVELVRGCAAVASCLGHTLSFRGIFGPPRRLVAEATRRLCLAIQAQGSTQIVRFVLMNTAGHRNRDAGERISAAQRCVIRLLRALLPPHADNEEAAEYLRMRIGQADPAVAWVVVRPDTLIDQGEAAAYDAHPSPTRSAIFNAGVTSRNQVGRFMADLITDDEVWKRWRGRMPVIYSRALHIAQG